MTGKTHLTIDGEEFVLDGQKSYRRPPSEPDVTLSRHP
jgi:hypothetical protein